MAKRDGKIVRIGKGFGFMKLDDGSEAFVHHSSYIGPMVEGDQLKANIGMGPKGPRAEDVELVSRGTAKPVPPTTSPPTSTPASQEIEINWHPGVPFKQGRTQVLPLTLSLTGAKGKSDLEVKLKVNKVEVTDPSPNPSPDGKGNVVFLVPLVVRTKLYVFNADAVINGKVEKNFTYIWEKRSSPTSPATAATPATDAEKKLPEIEVVNPPRDLDPATGMFLVNVVTRKDGKKTNRDFTAFCDQVITINQPSPTGLSPVTTFTPVTTGQYQLHINFPGVMVKIVFKLDNGKEAIVHLRK